MLPTYNQLRSYRDEIGAPFFLKPFDLNLFVVRSDRIGFWDDLVVWGFTDDAGNEVVEGYPATGDASKSEWLHSTHPDGCLWTMPQHCPGGLELGTSNGRPALRQRTEWEFVRWPSDRKRVPEISELLVLPTFRANRHVHIHGRVSGRAPMKPEPGDSQACVVTLYQHHLAASVRLVQEQEQRYHTAIVSPTFCQALAL